jgi:hypothetical protein
VFDERAMPPLFGVVIVVALAAAPVLSFIAARRAWQLASSWQILREARYPTPVMLRVAFDRHTDTAQLLNGVEVYAVADDAQRARFIRSRNIEAICIALATVLTLIGPLAWALGFGANADAAMLTSREAIVLIGAPFASLIAAALVTREEQQFRFAARARLRRRRARVQQTDLMLSWMQKAGVQPRRPLSLSRTLVSALMVLGIVPAAVIIAFAAATLMFVHVRVERGRARVERKLSGREEVQARQDTLLQAMAQSIVPWTDERSGLLPVAFTPEQERRWMTFDTALARRYPRTSSVKWEFAGAEYMLGRPDRKAATLAALAADTMSPSLMYWRAFAHAGRPKFLWFFKPGAVSRVDAIFRQAPWQLSSITLSEVERAGWQNLSVALLAFDAGHVDEAIERVRENVAGILYLRESTLDRILGLRQTAAVAGFIADRDRRPSTRAFADSLAQTLELGTGSLIAADRLAFFNPLDTAQIRYLTDSSQSLAIRAPRMLSVLYGYCTNAREIMFGVDRRRLATIDSIERRSGDQRLRIFTQSMRATITVWIEHPDVAAQLSRFEPAAGLINGVRYVGLGRPLARLQNCWAIERQDSWME